MAFSVHLLAVTGGVESDDALWIPLYAETGPKEDHAVLALQHILKVHKHEIFFDFFCRNRNHIVPRACNTRFLKIFFELAEIFDF